MIEYPVVEMFYSLKGEGLFTGVPMSFIRLAYCNKQCFFCDTDFSHYQMMSVDQITDELDLTYERVVITGGEPLVHDLRELIAKLHRMNRYIHLETNGSLMLPTAVHIDWIALSPKDLDCHPHTVFMAHEIKFLVGDYNWKVLIDNFLEKYEIQEDTILYVMPITKGLKEGQTRTSADFKEDNVLAAIDYCKKNPRFRYCVQLHKVLNIP